MTRTLSHAPRMLALAVVFGGAALVPAPGAAQTSTPETPTVKVSRLAAGRVLIEVANNDVAIRKEVTSQSSHVVITTPADELQIRVSRGELTLSTPLGSATLSDGQAEDTARVMALLQRSDAAARGRELLKRLPEKPNQFGHHALLLTRAILELATGPSSALMTHRRWALSEQDARARRAASAVGTVTRIGLQSGGSDRGPADCWDVYAKEAIRIADDLIECFADIKVLFPWSGNGCKLVYIVRAEAAMFWFINCSGGFPFSG